MLNKKQQIQQNWKVCLKYNVPLKKDQFIIPQEIRQKNFC